MLLGTCLLLIWDISGCCAADDMEKKPAKRLQTRGNSAAQQVQKRARKRAQPQHDMGRSVRPRPLKITARLPVFWGNEPSFWEVRGGTFAKYCEDLEAGRAVPQRIPVVGHLGFKPLPDDLKAEPHAVNRSAQRPDKKVRILRHKASRSGFACMQCFGTYKCLGCVVIVLLQCCLVCHITCPPAYLPVDT